MKHCCRILTLFICLLNIYFAQGENRYIYLGSSSNQHVTSAHKWSLLSIEITDDYIKLYHKCTPTKAPTWICSSHNQLIEDSYSSLKSYIYKSDIGFVEQKYILNGYHDKYFYEYYTPLPKHVTHINIRDEKGFYVVKNLDIREKINYGSAIPEDAIFCIQDTYHPFYDRGEIFYKKGDYANAIINLEQSLKYEFYNVAYTYTMLCIAYLGTLRTNDNADKFVNLLNNIIDLFTPIDKYATDESYTPLIVPLHCLVNQTYLGMSTPSPPRRFDLNNQKEVAIGNMIKKNYADILNYFPKHIGQSIYANYGFIKFLLGESDYAKYLKLGGNSSIEYIEYIRNIIPGFKLFEPPTNAKPTQSKQQKGLTKDPNFKIK